MFGPQGLCDLLPDAVLRIDRRSGRVLEANASTRGLLGFDPTDAPGSLAASVDRDSAERALTLASALDAEPQRADICVRGVDGPRWLDVVAVGESPEVALIIGRDVTERRARESHLDNIINTIADPIFVKNERFEWTALNDEACKLIGRPRESLLGRTDHEVFPAEEADVFREKDEAVFDHHFDAPLLNIEAFTDSTGAHHTIATKKRAFLNQDGSKTLVGVIRDITELVELQQEKDAFLASVSHELRTPLTLMLAPLESMLAGDFGPLSDRLRHTCETMHNNAVRLLQMVTSLLDLSKLEAGRVDAHPDPVDVVALTGHAVRDFQPLATRKDLTLEFEATGPTPTVMLDRYLFDRIVFNLLSNAVKFTPEGGRIDVALDTTGDEIELRVCDTGIGIASAEQPRLFEKFSQVEGTTSRRHEGTGLGLALVSEFAELLGGSVDVDSEVGVGSTFTVRCAALGTDVTPIPHEHRGMVEHYAHESIEQYQTVAGDSNGLPRVLVVEDNPVLATYIARLLEERCQLKLATDGGQGWRIALEWHPDLVLSDIMMPERDGFTLCRDLKQHKKTRDIPVVLLTALTHRDALLKGWEAGADEYLFKPFHPRELITRVNSLLDAVQARRRAAAEVVEHTKALTRAETMLEQVEMFAFISSHHLQEPLRKVLLFGDLLETETEGCLSEESLDHLHRLENAARTMSRYIQDLREFSSVTKRHVPFDVVPLGDVMRGVVDAMAIEDATVEIEPLPDVCVDTDQIRQLFTHLFTNALRHRGDEPLGIQVRCANADADFAEIEVQDNGCGFEGKYAERIFRPFERLEGGGAGAGSGMGLAICRLIALRHHGSIVAAGEPGRGATFRVRLPIH